MSAITVSMDDQSNNATGYRFYYRESGESSWVQDVDLTESAADSNGTVTHTINNLDSRTKYEIKGDVYTEHTSAETSITTATTYLETTRSIASTVSPIASDTIRTIDVFVSTTSHTNSSTSMSSRTTSFPRTTDSHTAVIDSTSSRTTSSSRSPTTAVYSINSWAFNDRTSLEVMDFDVTWDDDEQSWYTDWFEEHRVLGDEDTMAIMSFVTPNAKEPCATVYVEYDEDGDEQPEETSNPIRVTDDEKAHEVTGITLNDGGSYRLKITEYSGYNSLYNLNIGFTHQ